MKIIIGMCVWLSCGVIAAGAFNADFRGRFPDLMQSPSWAAHNRGTALGFGIVTGPVGMIIITFLSGGFYHGWTLSAEPAPCTKTPEIWCTP